VEQSRLDRTHHRGSPATGDADRLASRVRRCASRLAYADEELPTRRQQREQRERDEQYANLATDEDDARDAAAAYAPLTTTLREIDPAVSTEVSTPDENLDDNDDAVDVGDRDPNLVSSGSVTANTVDPNIVNPKIVDLDTVDDVIVAADSVEPPPTRWNPRPPYRDPPSFPPKNWCSGRRTRPPSVPRQYPQPTIPAIPSTSAPRFNRDRPTRRSRAPPPRICVRNRGRILTRSRSDGVDC